MSDLDNRSIAAKLAAAKKKHKAYMKEKGIKNSNSNEEEPSKNLPKDNSPNLSHFEVTNQLMTDEIVSPSVKLENEAENPHSEIVIGSNDSHEANLPLPSVDYSDQYKGTSLPDPLAFFDNFNVGTKFQSLAQPIASFFNNSNGHSNESNNVIDELSNLVIVEESMNTEQPTLSNVVQNLGTTPLFSYDKFKNNALQNRSEENNLIDSKENLNENISLQADDKIFDQFANSIPVIEIPSDMNNTSYIQNESFNLDDVMKNSSSLDKMSVNDNNQGNFPVLFEMRPQIVGFDASNENITEVKDMHSNAHDLQTISERMDNFIKQEQTSQYIHDTTSNQEIQQQNNELLSSLQQQNSKCSQLNMQLQEYEIKYAKLLTDYRALQMQKEESEMQLKFQANIEIQNELSKLKEDLQCHLQTIGVLVAEKTELTSLLNETQSALHKQSSEYIELQNKFHEMQKFYTSLGNELEVLKNEKLSVDNFKTEQEIKFNQICKDYDNLKQENAQLKQDQLESEEKIKIMNESNSNLEKQIQELNGHLSLANIKIQQLTLGETAQIEGQLDAMMQEKLGYEKQINYLNETLNILTKEREDSNLQFQQYAEQLNTQITNLVAKLEQNQRENEQLRIQEENRIKHIGNLEKQLQNSNNDGNSANLQRNNSFLKKELENSSALAERLQSDKEELNTNFTKLLIEKELLEKELEMNKQSIGQLEAKIEQLKGHQPDNAVLLATMESDKVAASRAISQNNELKKQMDSMQEVLLKVNNDNVQLTESIALERETTKNFMEKLQKTEISYQTLAEAIEIKDKELLNLRDQLEIMSKQLVHQEQLSDRLRHYEAKDHSSVSLQNELKDAKQMIAHLTNELNILKQNQLNQTNQMNQTNQIEQINQNTQTQLNKSDHMGDYQQHNDFISQELSSDVLKNLREELENARARNAELESMLQNFATKEPTKDTNGNETIDKDTAMKHLEKKFLKTMEDIARLTEEKQKLEHIVLQLQGETETIGEYVTLYQQQRSILKQRALEKDQQLQQLTNDRETIKANLDRLNNLINKLIVEKGAITKELLEEHEHFSRNRDDLCVEHQKIHQEINKITSSSLQNSKADDNPNTEIAEEIISLLSEIKFSNLVQPVENIHPCPWCSGKLITV